MIDYKDPPPFHHMRRLYEPHGCWFDQRACRACGAPARWRCTFWESAPRESSLHWIYLCVGCAGQEVESRGPRLRVLQRDDLPKTRAEEVLWRVVWAWTSAEMAAIDRALGLPAV
jgi:hypothetical protein